MITPEQQTIIDKLHYVRLAKHMNNYPYQLRYTPLYKNFVTVMAGDNINIISVLLEWEEKHNVYSFSAKTMKLVR